MVIVPEYIPCIWLTVQSDFENPDSKEKGAQACELLFYKSGKWHNAKCAAYKP